MYKISEKELEDIRRTLLSTQLTLKGLSKMNNLPFDKLIKKDIKNIDQSVQSINSYIGNHE